MMYFWMLCAETLLCSGTWSWRQTLSPQSHQTGPTSAWSCGSGPSFSQAQHRCHSLLASPHTAQPHLAKRPPASSQAQHCFPLFSSSANSSAPSCRSVHLQLYKLSIGAILFLPSFSVHFSASVLETSTCTNICKQASPETIFWQWVEQSVDINCRGSKTKQNLEPAQNLCPDCCKISDTWQQLELGAATCGNWKGVHSGIRPTPSLLKAARRNTMQCNQACKQMHDCDCIVL